MGSSAACDDQGVTAIRSLALATGITGAGGMLFIGLFYGLGGNNPFGTLNDLSNALLAVLSGFLAWGLYGHYRDALRRANAILLPVAWAGALVAVLGSVLVIFGFAGWVLAGLWSAAGFALIGLWTFALNHRLRRRRAWLAGLTAFGIGTAGLMAVGLAAVPGILRGSNSLESMSAVANVLWQAPSFGWFVLYPVWCLWLSCVLRGRRAEH